MAAAAIAFKKRVIKIPRTEPHFAAQIILAKLIIKPDEANARSTITRMKGIFVANRRRRSRKYKSQMAKDTRDERAGCARSVF
ncbi:MAG: hypothetical protein AB7O04_10845 [Hyphomonadaceae bacterium]